MNSIICGYVYIFMYSFIHLYLHSVLSPKKIGIHRIPMLGTMRLKNEIGHVTHQSIRNLI
jgi:hypothetical protein